MTQKDLMLDSFIALAEKHGFSLHEYRENNILCGYELEKHTKRGVDMIHFLDCRDYPDGCTAANLVEELRKLCDDFSVDEQVDLHRQDERYRKDFTCLQSVVDFEDYKCNLRIFADCAEIRNWDHNLRAFSVRVETSVEWTGVFNARSEEEAIEIADKAWHSGEDMYNFFDNQEDPELISITIDK